jgi:hypothetical protein
MVEIYRRLIMVTLEEECMQRIAKHKSKIFKEMMIRYYETIQQGQVNLPDFMRDDTPEKLADKDLKDLVLNDINKFNSLYEKAYTELAPLLD